MAVVVGRVWWGHGCGIRGVAVGGRRAIGVTSTKVVVGAGLSAAVRGRGRGGVSLVVAVVAGAVS